MLVLIAYPVRLLQTGGRDGGRGREGCREGGR